MSPAPLLETTPGWDERFKHSRASMAAHGRRAMFYPATDSSPGDPRLVRIVNDTVRFRDRPDYLISLSRVATPLLGCVSHLLTKPWAPPETVRAFIAMVCEHHRIRLVETT